MSKLDDLMCGAGDRQEHPSVTQGAELPSSRVIAQKRLFGFTSDDADEDLQLERTLSEDGLSNETVRVLKRPITLTNIAMLLGREPRRVAGLLAKCPIIGYRPAGRTGEPTPLYDLVTAINFIARPNGEQIANYIRSQSTTTLPPLITKAFWESERTKAQFLLESGEHWHTRDVLKVFGETAKTIKDTMLVWVEQLPGITTMSDEQYDSFKSAVHNLQEEIYKLLVETPATEPTQSYLEDIKTMISKDTTPISEFDDSENT